MVSAQATELEGTTVANNQEGPDEARTRVAAETPLEELGLENRIMKILDNAGLKTVQDLLDKLQAGEKIDQIGPERSEEIHNRLAETGFIDSDGKEASAEQKHAAKEELERDEASGVQAPAESERATAAEEETTGTPSAAREETTTETPSLFSLRVAVDKRGRPQNALITHLKSGKKKAAPISDLQSLASFIDKCISPPVVLEPSVAQEPLTVSEVQVFRAGVRGGADFTLRPDEAFEVKVRFQLQSKKLISLAAQKPAYQVQVYTSEIISGTSSLWETKLGYLTPDRVDYDPEITMPGLTPGIHRLVTVVTVQLPGEMLGHYDGPLIRVTEG